MKNQVREFCSNFYYFNKKNVILHFIKFINSNFKFENLLTMLKIFKKRDRKLENFARKTFEH